MVSAKIYQPDSRNSVISPQATKITPQGVTWGDVMWMWNKSFLFWNWKISTQPNSRKKHKPPRGQWARSGQFSCALLMLQQCPGAGHRNHCREGVEHLCLWLNAGSEGIPAAPEGMDMECPAAPPWGPALRNSLHGSSDAEEFLFSLMCWTQRYPGNQDAAQGRGGISAWPACTPQQWAPGFPKSELFPWAFIENIILNHF